MEDSDSHQLAELFQFLKSIQNKDYTEAVSLPGQFYHDPDWGKFESRELFAKHWICVGRVEEVSNPGDFFCFDLVEEPVLIVRGLDNTVRALSNVCRHRGTVIAESKGNTKGFLCPYHHWAYDTTGRLVNAPSMQKSRKAKLKNCRLPEFNCEIWQGFIFVCLDSNPPDLIDSLSVLETQIKNYHLEEMQLKYLADESWEINWKCLVENFMEGYHLTPLHKKTLHQVNPSSLCRHTTPGEFDFGYNVGFTSRVPEERIGHPDLSEEQLDECVMFAVAPGLTVGIGSDYSSFLCIRPQSSTSVRIKLGLIFYGDSWSEQEVNDAIALFQNTMKEDKEVLLKLQKGLGSKFHTPGQLANQDLEGTIWDFYQYLGRHLTPE